MPTVVFPTHSDIADVPVDEFGAPLAYCWLDAQQMVFAETLTGIISVLIPGYAGAVAASDDAALFELRLAFLADLALARQEELVASLTEEILADDPESLGLPESVLQVLLSPKDGAVVDLDEWPLPFPLLLLTTQYAPYTEFPVPGGEFVQLLDPVSERGFLHSLQVLDVGMLTAAA